MLVSIICFEYTSFKTWIYLIQDSTLYLIELSSFSYMQQTLVNSLFIFIPLQIFSNFPFYGFLDMPFI